MRWQLFSNPRLLVERLAEFSLEHRRTSRLRGTPGAKLHGALLDSLELLELLSFSPDVIYDIGANTGTWTLLAKSIYPAARIVAFEPLEEHCHLFSRTTAVLQNVTIHKVALGSVSGQFEMHVPNRSDAASLLSMAPVCEEAFNLRLDRTVPVTVERLDDYTYKHKLPFPDLIKLDVQGFEEEVLVGGEMVLQRAKAVITEVSFKEFYKGQCRFDRIVSYLAGAGFFINAFGARTAVAKPLDQCDVLFLKSI